MSRLYEVYVLGLLQTQYPNQILFQAKGNYGTQCDYLHVGEGIILDAKYKGSPPDDRYDIVVSGSSPFIYHKNLNYPS